MKPAFRLAAKLAALLLPFPLAVMIAMSAFPMNFFDSEYGWYAQNQAYAREQEDYCRVLMMGDSSAKAALRPALLSEDSYNFALNGATAIEEYYYLREYLAHHDAPEYLVYMQGPWYLLVDQFFWSRNVFFHRIAAEDLEDMQRRLQSLNDLSAIGISSVREFQWEAARYRFYTLEKYSVVFLKGLALNLLGNSRKKLNEESYALALENQGQAPHTAIENRDEPVDLPWEHFSPGDLMEHYFRALIELCNAHQIQFVFLGSPMNGTAQAPLAGGSWLKEYEAYLRRIQADYPEAIINETLEWYDVENFSDQFHLNERGVERYCAALREKYPQIFDP